MQYIIGIDDTDNLESRGTGHLARDMAAALAKDFSIHGIVRHQLLEDPRVPKTSHNSSASILFEGNPYPLEELAAFAKKLDFIRNSGNGIMMTGC